MKKNYFVALLALFVNLATAQQVLFEPTSYRGAFAPAPTAQWTDSWTEFDPLTAVYPTTLPVVQVSQNITTNTNWTAGNVYELTGTIYVKNNVTLTIAPGTFIRSKSLGAALVITRGSKLNAIGTAAAPIVFTSKAAPGQRNRGDWGGIVLLGKSTYNINSGVNNIEGISISSDTQFGGGATPVVNDNSGTLKYVRIEFAGYAFSPNNELNGLTMGAVGNGTTIDYVQVSYSNDDSFEWFGGTVDCKHLVAQNGLDDDFDTDNGYSGRVQFGLSMKDPVAADVSTSECFESDNNSSGSAASPFTSAIFSNFTCLGPVKRATLTTPTALTVNSFHDKAARIRRASQLKVFNSLFLDFKTGVRIEDALTVGYFNADPALVKWKNNIISVSGLALPSVQAGVADTYALTGNGNNTTTKLTSAILVTPYPEAGTGPQRPYTGLDYRPGAGSIALASIKSDDTVLDTPLDLFSDATFVGIINRNTTTAPVVTSPVSYCTGATVSPLVAIAPTKVVDGTTTTATLKWYTSLTGGTGTSTQPVVSNTITKTYYVTSQFAGESESTPRTPITVTILSAPAHVLGAITKDGTAAATTNISMLVGTTTTTTYQIPAVTLLTGEAYEWTVPVGTTIVSGGDTNAITVRFNSVPAGGGAYGNISVRIKNAGACRGIEKSIALTSTLPTGITVKMFNDPVQYTTAATPAAIARTSFAEYMGTSAAFKLVGTATATASSYVWELPTGVSINNLGTAGTPTTKWYNVYPFLTTVSLPSSAVTSTSNRTFFGVTETVYSSGVTIATAVKRVYPVVSALPNGTPTDTAITSVITISTTNAEGVTSSSNLQLNPAFPIVSTTTPELSINFTSLTDVDHTYDYTTTTGVSTDVIRIGVKSRNGVGVSTTSNAALVNPTTTSTANLLTLTSTAPAAPATLVLTNPALLGTAATTAITNVSKFIGSTTTFKLTAAASVLAHSYSWELPNGVNRTDANGGSVEGLTSTDPFIYVNFANVASGTTSIVFGVKAVNGVGSSSSVNVAPNADRTAKLLTVASPVPAAPATLTLTNGQTATAVTVVSKFIRKTTTFKLIAAASVLANSYSWELPLGVNRTDADGVSIDELTSTDPFIYVNFADVPPGITSIVFGVKAVNGVGSSSSVNVAPNTDRTAKLLTVTATVPAAPATLVLTNPALSGTAATTAVTNISKFIGTTTTFKLTATASVLANTYSWELPSGVNRTDLDGGYVEGFTSLDPFIYVNFADVLPGTTVTRIGVLAVNGVGFSSTNNSALINPQTFSTAKLLTLTSTVPAAPATLVLTNPALSGTAATTAITNVSKFIDTTTILKLTATASVLANGYAWELPNGVNRTDASGVTVEGLTSTDPFIYVNFPYFSPTFYYVFGVKAVNGVGSSSSVNVAPNTDRTAKLLTVTATSPAAPATLTLTNGVTTTAITSVSKFIGTTTTFKLTAAASALANIYGWELPAGVNRTDADGVSIDESVSTDPFIFVNFADALPTASYVFRVLAGNGVGDSSFKTLTVTAGVPSAVTSVSGLTSVCSRSEGYEYTITAPAGATTYTITAPVGSMVTSTNGANVGSSHILATTDLTFKVVYTGGTAAFSTTDKTLRIVSGNVFGPATAAKALTLTKVTCPLGKVDMASPVMVSEVSIYPNPTRDNFNLELTTSVASEMSMTIYSMNGATVRTKNIQLSEGNNVINEDISSLANGIYFVRFNNPTNNETIVRKLIKI